VTSAESPHGTEHVPYHPIGAPFDKRRARAARSGRRHMGRVARPARSRRRAQPHAGHAAAHRFCFGRRCGRHARSSVNACSVRPASVLIAAWPA